MEIPDGFVGLEIPISRQGKRESTIDSSLEYGRRRTSGLASVFPVRTQKERNSS
jgi:hypothetical protein